MNKALRFYRKLSLMGKISLFSLLVLALIGFFADFLMPYDAGKVVAASFLSPSRKHLLGTDDLGMDIFSQILYGAKISIYLSLAVAVISSLIGTFIGVLAGYYGKIIDRFFIRIIDLFTVIPTLPLLIILSSFWKPNIKNIAVILIALSWVYTARSVRSKVIFLKNEPYIKAAKQYGAGFRHLFAKHFLPELYPLVVINIIRLISYTIIAEASLSFLGLGDPTNKTWGLVLNFALGFNGIYFTEYWKWWVVSPLLAILILVLSVSLFSKELESIINAKLQVKQ